MRLLLIVLTSSFLASAVCAAGDTPAHMELARSFFADLKPENTYYVHSVTGLRWKGDLFTSENVAKTDCSGFVTDILRRAHSDVPSTLSIRGGRKRPLAEDYYSNIVAQNGFARVEAINDVRIGDVIAWSYTWGTTDTGHVMFADSAPRKIKPYKPLVEVWSSGKFGSWIPTKARIASMTRAFARTSTTPPASAAAGFAST